MTVVNFVRPIRIAVVAAIFGVLFAGACQAQKLPLSYAPSSALLAKGLVEVGPFTYDPASTGKVGPNQVRNTALGDVELDVPVAQYYREALQQELRLTGVTLGGGNRVLTGEIKEFFIDDLGYSIDWTLDVRFMIKDKSGAVLYDAEKVVKNHTEKYLAPFNKQIRQSIEALIADPAFISAIN